MPTRLAVTVFALLATSIAPAGVMLGVEVFDTPGLPGYQTFDLTAYSTTGYVNGFSFYGADSINGPLHQGSPSGDPFGDRLFGSQDSPTDSRWLVDPSDGLQIGAGESITGMDLAYSFVGTNNDLYRSLPLARLVTNDPSAVRITGDFDIGEFWSDGSDRGTSLYSVDTRLSDITIGTPAVSPLPDRPVVVAPEPTVPPPSAPKPPVDPQPTSPTTSAPEPTPVPPVDPPTTPTVPDPPAAVTLEDYQQGIDNQASAIESQIEQLRAQLNELTALREASAQPGFEVPQSNPYWVRPALTVPWQISRLPDHFVTFEVIQVDLATPAVNLSTSTLADMGTVRSLSLDTNDFRRSDLLPISASSTATPEPSAALLLLVAVAAGLARHDAAR